ncbi:MULTISPECIES: hypothetical protein [Ramlibacter]|uniref:TnsA endonuclease N-terminal domain-containing protein n=1 Tax=Ramlibacter pinisoli TaxID=2682844 RepID=A0A6N8ILZ6_9BURK|nr:MULTISPECIES: hypothetical protein [Ramlibacter]MBA2960515.1 hypothetical protein [Ramlibacter sp. CGMCC 1.13660]MVQ27847.1 hypothetical protein [Ramlibacter pinisoli]
MRLDQYAREMARPLGLRGDQRRTEMVASITMGHELRVESPLEASTARALDIDPSVKVIKPQPLTIRLDLLKVFPTKKAALAAYPAVPPREDREDPDDVYVYTPDFSVSGTLGTKVLIECKTVGAHRQLESSRIQSGRAEFAQCNAP